MLKFSTGFRDLNNGMKAVVKGAVIGAGLAFVDGGAGADTITDSGNGFVTAGFSPGDKLFVKGATTAANDSALTGVVIANVAAGTLTLPTGVVNTAQAGAAGTVVACAKGGSLKDILKDGIITIYSGTQPSSPDNAVVGTALMVITVSSGAFVAGSFGNGLEMEDDPLSGVIEKSAAEVWSAVAIATGVAGWFRWVGNATDTGAASTTLPRVDGTVGVGNGDLNVATTQITVSKTYTVDDFVITTPEYYGA
jgi:hypothetical protein